MNPLPTANNSSPRIGLFDSGLGGLTILREVQAILPQASYVFCLDNGFFPYSEKEAVVLIERVAQLCESLVQREALDILVIACNTASTVCLPRLREILKIPVVGVVPAIKPASLRSKTKVMGLLATKGTVNREYTQELIRNFAQDVQLVRVGSTRLVELAEDKLRGQFISIDEIRAEITPLLECQNLDTIVLACTHFPHLLEDLKAAAEPRSFQWVDSGTAVAKRVLQVLAENTCSSQSSENQVYSTKDLGRNAYLEGLLAREFALRKFALL